MEFCEKCQRERDCLSVETEENVHYFCKSCIKKAISQLSILPYKNKEVRSLLKNFKKYLKPKAS